MPSSRANCLFDLGVIAIYDLYIIAMYIVTITGVGVSAAQSAVAARDHHMARPTTPISHHGSVPRDRVARLAHDFTRAVGASSGRHRLRRRTSRPAHHDAAHIVRNTPLHDGFGAHFVGFASYYSAGRRVASGGLFSANGYTCAHRTLPFGTQLRVANPKTGRSVVVIVNDRGPFVRGRVLDLSLGAARALGMIGRGVMRIDASII